MPDVLTRILQQRPPSSRLLLVTDQFEEVYTHGAEAGVGRQFVDVLLSAAEVPEVVLLLTLRADFLGQALAYRPLADALQDADIKMGPMNAAELSRAIQEPAAVRGVDFESGLVARILDDVAGQPGALPLLEFALTLLWERQDQGTLTHAAYEAIGQVEGALAHYADQTVGRLSPADQELAPQVFTQLVAPGAGTQDTRRIATRAELGETGWELVNRLAGARLVVTDLTPSGEEAAELVHEALIHDWRRLRGWMDADHAFRHWQERLRLGLHQWQATDLDAGALLRGAPLAEAENWLARRDHAIGSQELDYIQASIGLREKERRQRRLRLLGIASVLGLAAILVTVVTTLAATGQLSRWLYRPLPMQWVSIPAGEFLMGSPPGDPHANADEFPQDEYPQHTVYLDAYRIGKVEVTNRQYLQCVRAGVCRAPSTSRYLDPGFENHPVVFINWEDAQTFCQWNTPAGRLPSEAEWEKAARGDDGRTYPWGNQPLDCSLANYSMEDVVCVGNTSPVGSYPAGASPYGALDMAGNVWEWVADWYGETYYTGSPSRNPQGPESGEFRVLRGGSWDRDPANGRTARRVMGSPVNRNNRDGFRCARSP